MEQALPGIEIQMMWEAPTQLSCGKGNGSAAQGAAGFGGTLWDRGFAAVT